MRLFKRGCMINDNENVFKNEKLITLLLHKKVRPRHGHKYTKCKMCLSIVMGICSKEHLSNI